jgi:transcriptional regulator with XRE-family HTH domain
VIYLKEINLAEVLTAKRRKKGITQDELAAYIGVSKASVSKWETGINLPDITLLPVLASYFDISIDALMCYSPQLNKDEIATIYSSLSAKFAELSFEDVIVECKTYIKKYYSCYPFLLEMAVLYVNHAPLAPNIDSKNELFKEALQLCERVKTLCNDTTLASRAELFQAMCYLSLGEAERVLQTLGETVQVNTNRNTFIWQAYQVLGKNEKAKEAIQADLYQNLMEVFLGLLAYIQTNLGNYDIALEAYKRAEGLAEIFKMRQLNPNNIAILYVFGAHMYQMADKHEEAIEILTKYVELCIHDFFPFELRADAFFDRINGWLKSNSGAIPRSNVIIKESMLNDVLLSPVFDKLRAYPEYNKLINKLRNFIGGK